MFNHLLQFTLTPAHEQLLHDTTIDENGPGAILRDFESFLSYIAEKKVRLTKTYNLQLRNVRELNSRFTTPLELGTKRPVQKSYPHIHGLYLLVRSSGLTSIEQAGKTHILQLNQEAYQIWQSLNSTERYGFLLEIWLTGADPELIGEKTPSFATLGNLNPCLMLLSKLTAKDWQAGDRKDIQSTIRYFIGDYNFGIMNSFGLIKAEFGPPKAKKGWYLNRLGSTSFGEALASLLASKFRQTLDPFSEIEEEDKVSLQSILQPYFPEWQKKIVISVAEEPFQEGTHVFKVSLGKSWRRIAIPADKTLHAFAYAILASVNFDDDHLYCFTYRDRLGMQVEINHPYMNEGYLANETQIGDLALYAGQTMTFLFDFGDNWEFNITFERLETKIEVNNTVLLEEHGEPPEQYQSWDEDEWDEEDDEE